MKNCPENFVKITVKHPHQGLFLGFSLLLQPALKTDSGKGVSLQITLLWSISGGLVLSS